MTRQRIYLGIPVYGGMHPNCVWSINQTAATSQMALIEPHCPFGDSLICRQRNRLVSDFWHNSKCDWLLSWDADIQCMSATPEHNAIDILLNSGKQFVGGLYAKRFMNLPDACSSVFWPGQMVGPDTGLVRMRWLSGGFTLVHRDVVGRLIEAYPEQKHNNFREFGGEFAYALYQPFITELEGGLRKYLSEDWAFHERWHKLGGEVWADTRIRLRHYGECGFDLFMPVQPHSQGAAKVIVEAETNAERVAKELLRANEAHDGRRESEA